jgi:tetratricopeptide (TPR) repeat protein
MANYSEQPEWLEKIERYVAGELPARESRALEALAEREEELRELINFFRRLGESEKTPEERSEKVFFFNMGVAPASWSEAKHAKAKSDPDSDMRFALGYFQRLNLAHALEALKREIPPSKLEKYKPEDLPGDEELRRAIEAARSRGGGIGGSSWIPFVLGGVLFLLLGIAGWIFIPGDKPPAPKFVNAVGPIEDFEFSFGGGDNSPRFEKSAKDYYNRGAYRQAVEQFDQLLFEPGDDAEYHSAMRFYRAICLLRLGEIERAERELSLVESASSGSLLDESLPRFYLAIARCQKHDPQGALPLLEKVKNSLIRLKDGRTIGEIAKQILEQSPLQ